MSDQIPVPKILGADFELANSFIGEQTASPRHAAATLLAEIPGYPTGNRGGTSIEFNRRFLPSCGSSWYIDSDHLEGNLPEHTSAMHLARRWVSASPTSAACGQVSDASGHTIESFGEL